MKINLSRELLKFAKSGRKNFTDFVHDDINDKFAFFGSEFAQVCDIDGHKIKCVIVNAALGVELTSSESGNSEGVMKSRIILYCSMSEFSGLRRDLILRLNGELFTVLEFHAVNNYVWRILLERNE